MKKINWMILNIAILIEVALSYFLPFNVADNGEYKVGFPFEYLTAYNTNLEVNPMMSMHVNPLLLLANVAAIYFLIFIIRKCFAKLKKKNMGGNI